VRQVKKREKREWGLRSVRPARGLKAPRLGSSNEEWTEIEKDPAMGHEALSRVEHRLLDLYQRFDERGEGPEVTEELGAAISDLRTATQRIVEREVLELSAREQERIGSELHDGLGQELTGIASLAAALRQRLEKLGGLDKEADDAAQITELANRAVGHARVLVRGLCPVRLEEDGLMVSLMEMAEHVEYVHGCRCEFRCERPVRVSDHATATQLYHIAAEAVSHAARRGAASRITIALRADDGHGILTIEDDGLPRGDGLRREADRGTRVMRYRATMIGGELDIKPRDGGGTLVACGFDQ
jgi:signal transduction histidine kinase